MVCRASWLLLEHSYVVSDLSLISVRGNYLEDSSQERICEGIP